MNLTFLIQHVFTFFFTGKLNRFREFPQVVQITDTILFISSITVINWFTSNLQRDLYSDPNISQEEYIQRIVANIAGNVDFKFQYLFAVQICCLILRISMMLQFQGNIGPLIKIVGKMVMDFFNYTLLFVLLTLMFSIVGNINFIYDLKEFETFTNSVLTVIDASVGNFDTQIFVKLNDPTMRVVGEIYIISIVVCFNILLMNLIIAILASTFERFD